MAKLALVVGVRKYAAGGGREELVGAPRQAEAIAGRLRASQWDFVTDSAGREYHLRDEGDHEWVVRDELTQAVDDLFANVTSKDDLLFYFVGHASAVTTTRGSGQINENLLASDGPAVGFDRLARCVKESRARSITIILDCCHAGALSDLLPDAVMIQHSVALFLATTDPASDAIASADGAGFEFSSLLRQGLRDGHEGSTGDVTPTSLERWVRERLEASKPMRDPLQPMFEPCIRVESNDVLLATAPEWTARKPGASMPAALDEARHESPHHDLVIRTQGRRLVIGWLLQPDGEERPWRHQPPRLGESEQALAITRAGDDAAYVLVASHSGARLLRVEQDGSVRSAELDVRGTVRAAKFGVGRDIGLASLELTDGSALNVSVVGLDLRPGSGAAT